MGESLAVIGIDDMNPDASHSFETKIRCRTARRWLHDLGYQWKTVSKGVYIDGHEREDVVEYRQKTFIPHFEDYRRYMVWWDDDGFMHVPEMPRGQRAYALICHDESTFSANDGKRRLWMENDKQPLRQKSRRKGIMVSDFITQGGRLKMPDSISDEEMKELEVPRRL